MDKLAQRVCDSSLLGTAIPLSEVENVVLKRIFSGKRISRFLSTQNTISGNYCGYGEYSDHRDHSRSPYDVHSDSNHSDYFYDDAY